jgi:hypothetical protein
VRRAAKRDNAELAIVQTLQSCGWTVYRLSLPLDLLCAKRGRTLLAEVKTGSKKLRQGQEQFIAAWPGEVVILRTIEDALAL